MMKHTKVSYDVAEQIVADYQARVEGASQRLVDAYEGYLVNFLNLLNQGEMDFNDKPLRNFLTLFVKDPALKVKIHQWKYSRLGRMEILRLKNMVAEQFKSFTREELWNELVLVLLEMADRYKPREKTGFHNYMFKAFHYWVYRSLMRLISDPLVWNGDRNIDVNEQFALYQGQYQQPSAAPEAIHDTNKESLLAIDEAMDEINENWINGLTCSETFAELNPFERRILKLYYVDGLEDAEIAERLGCCRATVNRRRLKAKRKIADALKRR